MYIYIHNPDVLPDSYIQIWCVCGWTISSTQCCVASIAIVNCCAYMDGGPELHLEGVSLDVI
jgi:hypothetical protein